MTVTRPFRRTCRQFKDGQYSEGGRWMYVLHPKFAAVPAQYIRAFSIIQEDWFYVTDYVEPADKNLECYSYRIHELLMRTCIEIEANCKAILTENGYSRNGDWNMKDYKKLNRTHRLSSYEIKIPNWHGSNDTRRPFAGWANDESLIWYQAYNEVKHDRHEHFKNANFKNLTDAICALVAILSAQFLTHDYSASSAALDTGIGGPPSGFDTAIGGEFWVKFPDDWPIEDRYDFDWKNLANEPDPFQMAFSEIPK